MGSFRRKLSLLLLTGVAVWFYVLSRLSRLQTSQIEAPPHHESALIQALYDFQPLNYTNLPPLDHFLNNGSITGDPQMLLQFSLIGFIHSGGEQLAARLRTHPELQMIENGACALLGEGAEYLVQHLHESLPADRQRGQLCHGEILQEYPIESYRRYWPSTRLLIGVRHPIRWFEALYNARANRGLLHPNRLIGRCTPGMKQVCTHRGFFAWQLLKLAKTAWTPLTKAVASYYPKRLLYDDDYTMLPNPVLLYAYEQLYDDEEHQWIFRKDLEHYLNLEGELPRWNATLPVPAHLVVDICADEYLPVRRDLLTIARLSADWIEHELLAADTVHVSSRDRFVAILHEWRSDPCGNQTVLANETQILAILEATTGQKNEQLWQRWKQYDALLGKTRPAALPSSGKYVLPPISSILDQYGNLTGTRDQLRRLVQFAVIGFGKAGTTTLAHWLDSHPELQAHRSEVWALNNYELDVFVDRMYDLTEDKQRGYKCPGDILSEDVHGYLRVYFPDTKLFIGVRHPIWWFQSLYNFRIQNLELNETLPRPNDCIGVCDEEHLLTCTFRGFFPWHLMRLGKQYWNGTRPFNGLEKLIGNRYKRRILSEGLIDYVPNPVFLFELEQLADKNETRRRQFGAAVQRYLGLEHEFKELPHVRPGYQWNDTAIQAHKDRLKIDICEPQYHPLRQDLLEQALLASKWIREVFLNLPDVHVSSRDYFESILDSWTRNPCQNLVA